jgi:hypothetical protein
MFCMRRAFRADAPGRPLLLSRFLPLVTRCVTRQRIGLTS